MSKSQKAIMIIIPILIVLVFASAYVMARCVLLVPKLYSDNSELNEEENYYIKEVVLKAVNDRKNGEIADRSIYDATKSAEIIQLTEAKEKKVPVALINTDFMKSAEKIAEYEYSVKVNTYYLEESSDDCIYHITVQKTNNGYIITSFLLDA